MNLSQEIRNNNIILLIVSKEKYRQELIGVVKDIVQNINKMCYVCINEPFSTINNNLDKNSISKDKFFFIDTITKKVQEPPKTDNCEFVSAPNALTEISVAFSKALNEHKCDSAFFDTLSSLLVYEKPHSIIQFIHNIITKLRVSSGKGVFIVLKDDLESDLIKDLYMFVDSVVEIE